ncbi:hypothetical protein NQZ68_030700, partial [Dissostichus eleginoides]
ETKKSEEVVNLEAPELALQDQGQHWVPDLTPSQGGECGVHPEVALDFFAARHFDGQD